MECAAIKTFDYSDVTITRCLAAGASSLPSLRMRGGYLKEFEGQRFAQAVLDELADPAG